MKSYNPPPRNSAPSRLHRRCFSTGRQRANYRDFGLREMVHTCLLLGNNIKLVSISKLPSFF
ncbi:unnamed protein product [Linum tenue]|uniref:Ribosomal protein S14 n=1 Tax=Linum tenue TaxID=586396 RepID=A0AAV0H574_9ROSI|nr:unnamed protein product [Linum tenue]